MTQNAQQAQSFASHIVAQTMSSVALLESLQVINAQQAAAIRANLPDPSKPFPQIQADLANSMEKQGWDNQNQPPQYYPQQQQQYPQQYQQQPPQQQYIQQPPKDHKGREHMAKLGQKLEDAAVRGAGFGFGSSIANNLVNKMFH